MRLTKQTRVHIDLYNILKENAKTHNTTITNESREMATLYRNAKEVENMLGMDILKKTNRRPIVVLK